MKKKTVELETTINHSPGHWAEVYTTDPKVIGRYMKLCESNPELFKIIEQTEYSVIFSVHPKHASLYPKAPRKVNYTEEQRQALRDRLSAVRESSQDAF